MDFLKASYKLRKLVSSRTRLKYVYNKVRWHNQYETREHFMTKAMLQFILMKKGDGTFSEFQAKNNRVVDVLQITKKDIVGYEIETNMNNIKGKKEINGVDIVPIDLNKMPKSVSNALKTFEKWAEKYVV